MGSCSWKFFVSVAKYWKDIAEIGQRGHNHGLGPCKTFEIPQTTTSSIRKDGDERKDKEVSAWCEEIWQDAIITGNEHGNVTVNKKDVRDISSGKIESQRDAESIGEPICVGSQSGITQESQLKDQENPEGHTREAVKLPERVSGST